MRHKTARGNHLGLTLTGLVLLVGGVALALASQGTFGDRHAVLYQGQTRRFVHHNGSWLWPVVVAVAAIIGLALLRWLLVQVRTETLSTLRVDLEDGSAPGAGRTLLPAGALCTALESELEDFDGVRHARAQLGGRPDAPSLWLTVRADPAADLGAVRDHVTSRVVPDVLTALELTELPTYVRLGVTQRSDRHRRSL